mmetsp:Transcript_29155/g.98301  ORF Transcript_29155/g.98301 Transcript_29155/m.98301 type:complete len:237 (-) Transcript_29155:264-974(-)
MLDVGGRGGRGLGVGDHTADGEAHAGELLGGDGAAEAGPPNDEHGHRLGVAEDLVRHGSEAAQDEELREVHQDGRRARQTQRRRRTARPLVLRHVRASRELVEEGREQEERKALRRRQDAEQRARGDAVLELEVADQELLRRTRQDRQQGDKGAPGRGREFKLGDGDEGHAGERDYDCADHGQREDAAVEHLLHHGRAGDDAELCDLVHGDGVDHQTRVERDDAHVGKDGEKDDII